MTTSPLIIPIASGKGGVGKSVLTANLAMALAKLGHATIAVDLDLGGSNLYSFLGLPNDYPGIGDYLKARYRELDALLVPTPIASLQFLPGDVRSPLMANIPYAQKMRLIHHLRKLPGEYILLDLGAGSSFNTLDFFAISPQGLLVTTPDIPAIINLMTFLKNLIFRNIVRAIRKNKMIHDLVQECYAQPVTADPLTSQSLYDQIAKVDATMASQVLKICQQFHPGLVFNRGTHPHELKILQEVEANLNNLLSLKANHWGFIFEDRSVFEATRKQIPLISHYPKSTFTKDIFRIAYRIVRLWQTPPDNSAALLLDNTTEVFEKRHKR